VQTCCALYSKIKEKTIVANHIFSFYKKIKARALLLNLLVKERKEEMTVKQQ